MLSRDLVHILAIVLRIACGLVMLFIAASLQDGYDKRSFFRGVAFGVSLAILVALYIV